MIPARAHHNHHWRLPVRKLASLITIAAVIGAVGCNKTGEGEFQMETPDVDVDVSTDTTTIQTPSIGRDTVTLTVPTVKPPPEN